MNQLVTVAVHAKDCQNSLFLYSYVQIIDLKIKCLVFNSCVLMLNLYTRIVLHRTLTSSTALNSVGTYCTVVMSSTVLSPVVMASVVLIAVVISPTMLMLL